MGLLHRLFGGDNKIPYPPALTAQIQKACHALSALTAAHDGIWQIGEADWSVNQDECTIVFTSPKGIRAVAPVQIVGTYNTQDGSWLWGWDNPSVAPALTEHAGRTRAYGQEHGFDVLTTRKAAMFGGSVLGTGGAGVLIMRRAGRLPRSRWGDARVLHLWRSQAQQVDGGGFSGGGPAADA